MRPIVSIIIPNYNHRPFLRERIESVLTQTFQDFEVILLDDASSDGSAELLKGYKQYPKVSHVVINQQNSGSPFKQWRKGLELAQGEYVWIAESDDYAHERFLESLIAKFEKHPNLGLVYCDSYAVDHENKILDAFSDKKNIYFKTSRWSYDYTNQGVDELLTYFFYKTVVNNVSAALIKKSYLDDQYMNNLVSYRNAGDLFTYVNLAFKTDFGYVAQKLNFYRDHGANVTKKNLKNGVLYEDRFQCYLFAVERLGNMTLEASENKKLKKGLLYVLKKNAFGQLEFNSVKTVQTFLKVSKKNGFITLLEFLKWNGYFSLYSLLWKYNKSYLKERIKKSLS